MEELINTILQIGNRLVICNQNCQGINNNPVIGVIPRCLYLEHNNRNRNNGCVIVGINPGISNNNERVYYLSNQITYNTMIDFWNNYGFNGPYYNYLRDFANCLGCDGPILWTEIVKCECLQNNNNHLPLDTIRTCAQKFLIPELKKIPENWKIITAGRKSFDLLKYICLDRQVLGIPHPNSRGNFHRMFTDNARNTFADNILLQLNDFNNQNNIAKWLVT